MGVTAMVVDVITWFMLFAVLTSAYMVMFIGLQNARLYTNMYMGADAITDDVNINLSSVSEEELQWLFGYQDARGGLWAPLWALFGYFEPERYSWLVSALMWSYILIGSVVLVNLLVAMFADTYNKISEEAETEYIFLRCTRLFEYMTPFCHSLPCLAYPSSFGISSWACLM